MYVSSDFSSTLLRTMRNAEAQIVRSTERLATGSRLNRPSDDVASFTRNASLRAQIRGLTIDSMTAQTGISVMQTADAGLSSIAGLLVEMREYAQQAANSGAGSDPSLSQKFAVARDALDAVARDTRFGGIGLLDGTYGVKDARVTFELADTTVDFAADSEFTIDVAGTGAVTVSLQAASGLDADGAAAALSAAVDAALADGTEDQQAYVGKVSFRSTGNGTGIEVALVGSSSGDELVFADGDNDPLAAVGSLASSVAASGSVRNFVFSDGATTSVGLADFTAKGLGLDVASLSEPDEVLAAVDAALAQVDSERSRVGSLTSGFERLVARVESSTAILTDAADRISNADAAAEVVALSRARIAADTAAVLLGNVNDSRGRLLNMLL